MSKKTKAPSLKFAVGTAERTKSSVWIVVASITDASVYIGAGVVMRAVKVSLHESGSWRLAHTSESGITTGKTGTRVDEEIRRPAEFQPGWTLGLVVRVPNPVGSLGAPSGRVLPVPQNVLWTPPAAVRSSRVFSVFFTGPEAGELLADFDPEPVGTLALSNGETLRILSWQEEIKGRYWDYLEDLDREQPEFDDSWSNLPTGRFFHHSVTNGAFAITDIPLAARRRDTSRSRPPSIRDLLR